jgi:type III restriction enzyme
MESEDGLDDSFRGMAGDEIERFRRELLERGQHEKARSISDGDLLREVMNTVGKPGQLGAGVRCVVSVAMLTEGWDCQTVTHILGLRAFGTQLLCEQVIGRALRRQSYELNEEARDAGGNPLLPVEYADIFGIPFDFTAKPVPTKPAEPVDVITVKAVRPERDALEIRFPRVDGYRTELPEEVLTASFTTDSTLELNPLLVGPSVTRMAGIIGKEEDFNLDHLEDTRLSTILLHLTKHLLYTKFRDPGEEPKLHLFGQLKRIVKQWVDGHLVCRGGTYAAQLIYLQLADMACERIAGKRPVAGLTAR